MVQREWRDGRRCVVRVARGKGTESDRAGSWKLDPELGERERAGGVEQGGMLISDPMVFFMHACA